MNRKFKPNGGSQSAKLKSPGVRKNRPRVRLPKAGQLQMAPAAMTRPIGPQRTAQNRRLISFKEYVQDIAGSVAFSATSFSVQPGLSNLFAWLAAQAVNYQEYRFSRLRFVYETEKASSTSGKVMLAFQPDAGDSSPASKQEMLENQFKAANAVWAPCSLDCGGSSWTSTLYPIRISSLEPRHQDLRSWEPSRCHPRVCGHNRDR